MIKFGLLLLAYILGSIPFSYILGRYFRHDDIRKHGSGNIGTTNAFRVFGKIIGVSVLLLDVAKSGLLVFLVKNNLIFPETELFHPLIYGLAAVLGHIFPVWFKFRGGKGVASAFGLLLAYSPITAVALIPMFISVTFLTRYVSLASTFTTMTAAYLGTFLFLFRSDSTDYDIYFMIVLIIVTILIFIRHSSNFHRIRMGTENKISVGKKPEKVK
ncbi:MAG: glycerol-3-phosphate 1-O-acyltransferase PlsY [Bacilli bacterium]|nr:glycerol-3-phosphate 1-O-acyltransferase PlsY [Bacilli bacterium]MBN2877044.1 glycerol-3-phosphate 1-O-acyltransferase PlsY [Bacilli bacterium]